MFLLGNGRRRRKERKREGREEEEEGGRRMIEGVGTVKEQGKMRSVAITNRLEGTANFTILEMHRSGDLGFQSSR